MNSDRHFESLEDHLSCAFEPTGISPARLRAIEQLESGKASDYIDHFFDESKRKSNLAIVLARESIEPNKEHLVPQIVNLWDACTQCGIVVKDACTYVGNGVLSDSSYWGAWDYRLAEVVEIAKRHGAFILATEPNRLIRSPYCTVTGKFWDLQARECDLKLLRLRTSGVQLMTLIRPDATAEMERSEETKRGQRKFRTLKDRRLHLERIAIEMRHASFSLRKIEDLLGVPFNTVRRWTENPSVPFWSDVQFWENSVSLGKHHISTLFEPYPFGAQR